jgi:3-oxoacyl-[acyl-carrier-protein] synthase-3
VERNIGLLGIGVYLPPEIRTNDWWPRQTVERWIAERAAAPGAPSPATPPTEAMRRVAAAMARQALDPFQGMLERHVMAPHVTSSDMEVEAARRALAQAQLEPREIDLVLVSTPVPEYLGSNPGCIVHQALGIRGECLTAAVDASGNSFLAQLALALPMLAAGSIRHALLIQSAAGSRLLDPEDPQSPLFGDGAAAIVLGPVPARSVLSLVHRTDGAHPRSLVASVRGGRWYDGGRIVLHRGDLSDARQSFLETVDRAREVILPALERAGVAATDVDVYAAHQGTPWLRELTMEMTGMTRARYCDSMRAHGYLVGASVPFVLAELHATKAVQPGDLVVMLGGGVGATMAAAVMRWTLP